MSTNLSAAKHGHMSALVVPFISTATEFQGDRLTQGPTISVKLGVASGVILLCVYWVIHFCLQFASLYSHLRRAKAIGLPMKVVPFPPGPFSFFAFQILSRLRRLSPGTKLHQSLNMGRPNGYGLHKEMGDVFVTVSPAGLTLIVADPKVAAHVNSKRAEFPKPPNTGALINIYGRNVINTDGDIWRVHRRITGQVFSERLHHAVWQESVKQAGFMMKSWLTSNNSDSNLIRVPSIENDALRLTLNVITGTAYGCPLGWDENPPSASPTTLSFRTSVQQFNAHLMPIYLTPKWLLRFARRDSTRGRAWEAYTGFESYMRGLLDRQRVNLNSGDCLEENLLTTLIRAEGQGQDKESRKMNAEEVMGNTFIILFAGHETTANTVHYSLLLLAQRQDVQRFLLNEVDDIYDQAAQEGRCQLNYELDFNRARWAIAVMSETLRMYTPTGITNKWTVTDQPIPFRGRMHVIPQGTRISISGTGIHSNPKVWGDNAAEWEPSRWIIEGSDGDRPVKTLQSGRPPSAQVNRRSCDECETDSESTPSSAVQQNGHSIPPSPLAAASAIASGTKTSLGLLKPGKGSFLAFSEGARACLGKRVATVEFIAVIFTLLRQYRVELEEGWSTERVRKILEGRKPDALTRQPPEPIPLRFIRRS